MPSACWLAEPVGCRAEYGATGGWCTCGFQGDCRGRSLEQSTANNRVGVRGRGSYQRESAQCAAPLSRPNLGSGSRGFPTSATWQRTGRRQCKWCSLLPISPVAMQQGERLARLQTRSWHKLQPTNRCHSRTVITCCLSIIVVLTATLHTRTVLQSLVLFLRHFITMSPDCSSCTLDHATKQRL